MIQARGRALVLAGVQAADLVVTQRSASYGEAHLDHLGVPSRLRPVLPVVKVLAVASLLGSSSRPGARSIVAASLVAYYAAAATFHVRAGDELGTTAPAAGCALLAATLV